LISEKKCRKAAIVGLGGGFGNSGLWPQLNWIEAFEKPNPGNGAEELAHEVTRRHKKKCPISIGKTNLFFVILRVPSWAILTFN
jgi:hypothetical protein